MVMSSLGTTRYDQGCIWRGAVLATFHPDWFKALQQTPKKPENSQTNGKKH